MFGLVFALGVLTLSLHARAVPKSVFPPGIVLVTRDSVLECVTIYAGKAARYHRSLPAPLHSCSAVVREVARRYRREVPARSRVHVVLLDDEHWMPWVLKISPAHRGHTRAFVTSYAGAPTLVVRIEHLSVVVDWHEITRRIVHEAVHWVSGQYEVHTDPTLWHHLGGESSVEGRARVKVFGFASRAGT